MRVFSPPDVVQAQPQCPRCGSPRTALDARFCQICGARLTPPDAPADALLGAVLLGRYKLVGLLGEGGMGRVYLGEQLLGETTRRVAVKVLSAARSKDPYVVARFRREAAMIAGLEHPNTVRIHDYGEEDGRYFSVMEYLPGGSLADVISKGRLEPARVERIAWQLAGALDEAHRRGIVHRDLKPENVLLRRGPNGEDVAKVVDFGIARRPPEHPEEKKLTATGTVLGTPAFMAPEQFLGEPADARADVYALALVLYQMLTGGELPWRADSVLAWADMHLKAPPSPLRSHPGCEHLPERYERALSHALAKAPSDRPPSAPALVKELTGGDAPQREPTGDAPPIPYAPRPRGRPPWVWWAVGGLASVGAGYGVVALVLALRASTTAPPVVTIPRDAPPEAAPSPPRDPRRVRAEQSVREGHAAVAAGDIERAIRALTRAESERVLASPEVDPLRESLAALGGREVRRLLGIGSCTKALSTVRSLQTVQADGPARAAYPGQRRCRTPPA